MTCVKSHSLVLALVVIYLGLARGFLSRSRSRDTICSVQSLIQSKKKVLGRSISRDSRIDSDVVSMSSSKLKGRAHPFEKA